MKSILVDTQVLVWLLNGDKKLGPSALEYVSNPDNRLLVSYFSLFEIVIKASIGKMTYDSSVVADLPAMNIELAMPTPEHLQNYRVFNPKNRDPFDNVLLAVALTERCDFVSSDNKILSTSIKKLKIIDAKK